MGAAWLGELLGRRCVVCGASGAALCPRCRATLHCSSEGPIPGGLNAVAASWAYEGAARAMILALKVRGSRTAAEPLVRGMIAAVHRHGSRGQVLTWVPGRSRDITARGFDHAELLARGVGQGLGIQVRGLLKRQAAARDQSRLSAEERAANVRGAFSAEYAPARVLLVDDLITTGATAGACARALRAAGAHSVELVVACRVA